MSADLRAERAAEIVRLTCPGCHAHFEGPCCSTCPRCGFRHSCAWEGGLWVAPDGGLHVWG